MKNLNHLANLLKTNFADAAIEANQSANAVQRVRKFTPVLLAQTFILALLDKPHANHVNVADTAACLGVSLSPQAIEQRYTPQLQVFFEKLFQRMVQMVVHSEASIGKLLERFTEVRLIDSSVVTLPDSQSDRYPSCGGSGEVSTAALKLQTEWDLRCGKLHTVQIEPGKQPDQATSLQHLAPPAGALRITDLGYFNLAVFAMIDAANAFFLSRTQHTVSISVHGQSFNLIAWLRSQKNHQVDQEIIAGTQNKLRCRLMAWRVPPAIAARRRRRLRENWRKMGRAPSQGGLTSCDWEYLITNLSEDQLTLKEAIVLYRSRWQIELLFKRWKSSCRIDLFDGRNDEIGMTRFWIRMCASVLQHWFVVILGWPRSGCFSLAKLADLITEMSSVLAANWNARTQDLIQILQMIERRASVRCRPTKRRKPSTIELLNDPEKLEYVLT